MIQTLKMTNKIFTAICIPEETNKGLLDLRPLKHKNIYFTRKDKLHLTLNFIGDTDIDLVTSAIKGIGFNPFELSIDHIGRFSTRNGGSIFWAGIKKCTELEILQKEISSSLSNNGISSDSRRYIPHITLARSRYSVPKSILDNFHQQPISGEKISFKVDQFQLINSIDGKYVTKATICCSSN